VQALFHTNKNRRHQARRDKKGKPYLTQKPSKLYSSNFVAMAFFRLYCQWPT
jgi:hypothetical protein